MYVIPENSKAFLSEKWKEEYSEILNEEHWSFLIKELEYLLKNPVSENRLPYFNEETTPSLLEVKKYFLQKVENEKPIAKNWAKWIENSPFSYLLILLGQRFTSASSKDATAIPPLKETLIQSCFELFNPQICVATRAWEKHVGRTNDDFWGEIKGNPQQKNEFVQNKIKQMIENKTWWNIFFHYKHALVYEIRVESGHGIRWNKDGTSIIGFLEPFINED
ncbi:hypothetical protein [Aureivirga sp. CE67]|uniref:hypothetical protein n=1 Tax=Aureivirga sp. CE67 TaxID=1788983 RepID=UPI0018C9A800|nr:hypothetical protein [Aureivirga sp. CE67]